LGSALHTDFRRNSVLHPHVVLYEDDVSRLVLAGGKFPEETTDHVIEDPYEALASAASTGPTIRELNTDRGTEFFVSVKSDRPEATFGLF
jgi:hypothetical protein